MREKEKKKTLYEKLKKVLSRIHKKGRKRVTIMLVPHTEKKILSWHSSLYTLFTIAGGLSLAMVLSIISLVNRSGEGIQYYDMGLGNRQFGLQAVHIAEEIIPLHKLIRTYTNAIAQMYMKMDGDISRIHGLDKKAQLALDAEIRELSKIVKKCRGQQEKCSQENTKEILRKAIYLSTQDNHNIKKSIDISKQIIAILSTKEKKSLFKNTPSISPTQGYLLTPYGEQVDPLRGRKVFKRGIEIASLPGTEVMASAPGKVIEVSYNADYGLTIHVQHIYGISTFYAHLDRVRVKEKDKVDKGEVIGYVGRTGNAAIPMLYYEVHVGTAAYDPYAFMNHLQDPWISSPKI